MPSHAGMPLGLRLCVALGVCLASARAQLTGTDKDLAPYTPGATTMKMSPPLTNIDSNAVCMDGSSANYYFSPGSGSGASIWLVFLQGGFWCDGQSSCQQRVQQSKFMTSSVGWSPLYALEGIFASDASMNPSFYNANLVFLKYCSGDSWMGDASAFGYEFRGRAIINATVISLIENHGLSNGAHFLFGGCSAGGLGALVSIDSVSRLLDSRGITSIRFGGFFDASGWPDISAPPWLSQDGSEPTALVQSVQLLATFINPDYPPECIAANPGQEYLCIYPSVRLPYVQTPFLLNAAQFDSFYFDYTLDGMPPMGAAQLTWAETYQQASLNLFADLPSTASVFSTACEGHCLALNTTFSELNVNGVPLSTVLAYWFFDNAGSSGSIRNVDPCIGWGCTNNCGGGMWSPTNSECVAPPLPLQEQYGFSPNGGGAGPYCGTPGAVPSQTVTQDNQAAAFVVNGGKGLSVAAFEQDLGFQKRSDSADSSETSGNAASTPASPASMPVSGSAKTSSFTFFAKHPPPAHVAASPAAAPASAADSNSAAIAVAPQAAAAAPQEAAAAPQEAADSGTAAAAAAGPMSAASFGTATAAGQVSTGSSDGARTSAPATTAAMGRKSSLLTAKAPVSATRRGSRWPLADSTPDHQS